MRLNSAKQCRHCVCGACMGACARQPAQKIWYLSQCDLTFFFFFFFFFVFFFFVLVLSLFYRSQMVNFKEIYHFSRFQRGPTFSRGFQLFPRGVQLLIPYNNPYNLWFSRGVRTPCPPLWIRTCKISPFAYASIEGSG